MSIEKPRITAKIAGRRPPSPAAPLRHRLLPRRTCAADLVYTQAGIFVREGAPEFASITEWLLGTRAWSWPGWRRSWR